MIKFCRCSSAVGRIGSAQTLSLGSGCMYPGIIQHEFMHALGFWHEQSRTDRDQYVTVLLNNVIDGLQYNFKKVRSILTFYFTVH